MRYILAIALILSNTCIGDEGDTNMLTARQWVEQSMQRWRGQSSIGEMRMTIHRPDWQRSIQLKTWTSGLTQSLILVTSPAKDKGNATLLMDEQLWSYSPKINRVIKIPSSMMNQSWLGSDFSNRDITRSTEILDQYEFELIDQPTNITKAQQHLASKHTIITIQATPHDNAPVVWGKEILVIRDDLILLKQDYFDQSGDLIKTLQTLEIKYFDDRPVASHMRVSQTDTPDEWTDMEILQTTFDIALPNNTFTLSNLRSVAR